MKSIKVKTPAKINLTLEILNKREDGFHNIQSVMQAVSLYDYLDFKAEKSKSQKIVLQGNSDKIPYNGQNMVYKAAELFFKKTEIHNIALTVCIEKNIPVSAGLAGGSSNAAGALHALNIMFDNILSGKELNELCASLGSDLNFCLTGGCKLCTSRGEITQNLKFYEQPVSLIKPKNLSISAKEAYAKFSMLKDKTHSDNTTKLKDLLEQGKFDKSLIYNSLERALFPYYNKLQEIKNNTENSLMSGSGSAFFVLDNNIKTTLDRTKYDIFENLTTINGGVEEVK